MGKILFAAFVVVPLIEIAGFIKIGGLIGLGPTLLVVVATAIVGAWLVRQQGFQVIEDMRRSSAEGKAPVREVMHAVFILAAGLLLLTPGFFTDAVGFALLVPAVRDMLAAWLLSRMQVHVVDIETAAPSHRSHEVIIEGSAIEVDEEAGRRRG